jgi:hypothetical protein
MKDCNSGDSVCFVLFHDNSTADVPLGDRIRMLSNGSLAIDDVRSSDAGDYTCRAENEDGADEIVISLAVQGKRIWLLLSVDCQFPSSATSQKAEGSDSCHCTALNHVASCLQRR